MSTVHVHAPRGVYVGQVRKAGAKLWRSVGNAKSAKNAMVRAVKAMKPSDKRARVLFCAEWYDPNVVMELSR